MKHRQIIGAVLAVSALSLAAAPSFAAGCSYGSRASMASAERKTDPVVEEKTDPELLAMLKKRDEKQSADTVVQN